MYTLTYDSYIGIIISALFADLGLFCTIVSTNYNFRKKNQSYYTNNYL